MNKEQLKEFHKWFDGFIKGFYGDDEFVNANIKMKEDHSRRVCGEMIYLAKELKLDPARSLLAETIGLFHDLGRFPQFIKYKTYNDPRSVNHCLLSLEVMTKENLLKPLPEDEKQIIETAIRHHGEKQIPANLAGDTLLFCKMIRDADKLDIYHVVTRAYIQHRDDPDNFKLEIEFPDTPGYSPDVLDAVINQRLIDYKILKSWNDMKLCILGWVYDINFPAALKRIKQRKCLELIFDFLPNDETTQKVRRKIFDYLDSRLKQAS